MEKCKHSLPKIAAVTSTTAKRFSGVPQQYAPGSGRAREDGSTAGFVFLETARNIPGGVRLRPSLLEVFSLVFVCSEAEGTPGCAGTVLQELLFFFSFYLSRLSH